jgi:hypothetical protein
MDYRPSQSMPRNWVGMSEFSGLVPLNEAYCRIGPPKNDKRQPAKRDFKCRSCFMQEIERIQMRVAK